VQDTTVRQALSDALRYWEPRRILYNGALALVVTIGYVAHLPGSHGDLTFNTFRALFVLAVLANVAYCAVYLVDFVVLLSAYRDLWLRTRRTRTMGLLGRSEESSQLFQIMETGSSAETCRSKWTWIRADTFDNGRARERTDAALPAADANRRCRQGAGIASVAGLPRRTRNCS
jgi:hypothetical protein